MGNKDYDSRLARHLIAMYHEDLDTSMQDDDDYIKIDQDLLRDYIGYCRSNINPGLSDEARDRLVEMYVDMRRSAVPGTVSAYPRQLESLIRLSEAHAKVRLSPIVEQIEVDCIQGKSDIFESKAAPRGDEGPVRSHDPKGV